MSTGLACCHNMLPGDTQEAVYRGSTVLEGVRQGPHHTFHLVIDERTKGMLMSLQHRVCSLQLLKRPFVSPRLSRDC